MIWSAQPASRERWPTSFEQELTLAPRQGIVLGHPCGRGGGGAYRPHEGALSDTIEMRLAHWEGGYQQIDKRLGTVEQRLTLVETKLDGLRRDVDQRFDRVEHALRTRFYGLVGLMLSLLAFGVFRH